MGREGRKPQESQEVDTGSERGGSGADPVSGDDFTGFSMNTENTAEKDRKTVHAVQQMAVKYGIAVGFGWTERTEGKARNHYTVTDGNGETLCDYVKLHPFSYSGEDCFFEAGQELVRFSVGNLRIGILLCYDLRFPEPFQVLAECCDLIVVPANWPERRPGALEMSASGESYRVSGLSGRNQLLRKTGGTYLYRR